MTDLDANISWLSVKHLPFEEADFVSLLAMHAFPNLCLCHLWSVLLFSTVCFWLLNTEKDTTKMQVCSLPPVLKGQANFSWTECLTWKAKQRIQKKVIMIEHHMIVSYVLFLFHLILQLLLLNPAQKLHYLHVQNLFLSNSFHLLLPTYS